MSHNPPPHGDGWDLPEVVPSAQDPRTAPIPAPEAGLESYYAPGDESGQQKGLAPSPHGTAATTATATTGKEVYTGSPPPSDMQASKYTAEGQTVGAPSEAEGGRTGFWTRRKIWIAVVVGVVIVIAVVVGPVVATQVGGKKDSSSDDQRSSPTSTSDDNSPTPTANTAFGTPTSFPSSLAGSDSACTGTICGATLALASPVGSSSSSSSDSLLLFALGSDGSFLYREADATGWKGNWTSLGGDFESQPAVVASSSGRLDVFGVSRADLVMHYKTFRAGSWDARWTSLGGDCYAPPALCGFADGTLLVVSASSARQMAVKRFKDGTWDRPGTADWNLHNTGYVASNPATACTAGRNTHVLAYGGDERGAPYELMLKRDNGTRMDYWRTTGGDFQAEPVTFVEDADGDVFTVFGLGADDAELYHGTYSAENATTLDEGSPKRVGGPSFMSVPSVVRNPKGDIDILAVDRDGKLRRAAFDREATLDEDDWQDLGGFFSSAPAARLTANDSVSVFGIGPEGSIIHGRWTVDDDGEWTDGEWFDDGGDFSSRWYRPGPA